MFYILNVKHTSNTRFKPFWLFVEGTSVNFWVGLAKYIITAALDALYTVNAPI